MARPIILGALAALVAAGGTLMTPRDDGAVAGREVFPPATSRPTQAPSPGRTGSGGGCTNTSLPGGLIETRCDGPHALPCYRQVARELWLWGCDGVPRPAPEPRIGGVYCAGQTGLDWEWVSGGVLTYVMCDGVRVRVWAFTLSVASSERADATMTAEDTHSAIERASARHGVPVELLTCLVSVETGGTFSPYAVGDGGQSLGPAQLYSGGLLSAFYAAGYTDPFDPYEALDYMAGVVADGGGPWNWYTAWRLCSGVGGG